MTSSNRSSQLQLALTHFKQQEKPNVAATARKYELVHSTLRRHWKAQSNSPQAAPTTSKCRSNSKCRLTPDQEELLIDKINHLADRGMLATHQIVRNLAEEINGGPVYKNWIEGFIERNWEDLDSPYLQDIDKRSKKRKTLDEYVPLYRIPYQAACSNDLVSEFEVR